MNNSFEVNSNSVEKKENLSDKFIVTVLVEKTSSTPNLGQKADVPNEKILPYYYPKKRGNIGSKQFSYETRRVYIGVPAGERDALTFDSIDQITDPDLKVACTSQDRLISAYDPESKEDLWEDNLILKPTQRDSDSSFSEYQKYKNAGKNVLIHFASPRYDDGDGPLELLPKKLGLVYMDGVETILRNTDDLKKFEEIFQNKN